MNWFKETIIEIGKFWLEAFLFLLPLLLIILISHNLLFTKANASELELLASDTRYPLFQLQELKFGYDSFLYARDPNFIYGPPKDRIQLDVNTNILRHIEWRSNVHGTTDNNQFRWVGLKMGFGLNITDHVQFGYRHHSQHIMDAKYPYGKFPVEDSLYIELLLYSKHPKDGIF